MVGKRRRGQQLHPLWGGGGGACQPGHALCKSLRAVVLINACSPFTVFFFHLKILSELGQWDANQLLPHSSLALTVVPLCCQTPGGRTQ